MKISFRLHSLGEEYGEVHYDMSMTSSLLSSSPLLILVFLDKEIDRQSRNWFIIIHKRSDVAVYNRSRDNLQDKLALMDKRYIVLRFLYLFAGVTRHTLFTACLEVRLRMKELWSPPRRRFLPLSGGSMTVFMIAHLYLTYRFTCHDNIRTCTICYISIVHPITEEILNRIPPLFRLSVYERCCLDGYSTIRNTLAFHFSF